MPAGEVLRPLLHSPGDPPLKPTYGLRSRTSTDRHTAEVIRSPDSGSVRCRTGLPLAVHLGSKRCTSPRSLRAAAPFPALQCSQLVDPYSSAASLWMIIMRLGSSRSVKP